jgi:hypothetical protein
MGRHSAAGQFVRGAGQLGQLPLGWEAVAGLEAPGLDLSLYPVGQLQKALGFTAEGWPEGFCA